MKGPEDDRPEDPKSTTVTRTVSCSLEPAELTDYPDLRAAVLTLPEETDHPGLRAVVLSLESEQEIESWGEMAMGVILYLNRVVFDGMVGPTNTSDMDSYIQQFGPPEDLGVIFMEPAGRQPVLVRHVGRETPETEAQIVKAISALGTSVQVKIVQWRKPTIGFGGIEA